MTKRRVPIAVADPTIQRLQAEVARLREELLELRWTLLHIQSDEARRQLTSFLSVETEAESTQWRQRLVDDLVAFAVPTRDGLGRLRAPCPLCGTHPDLEVGYLAPEELVRHFSAGHHQRMCPVTSAAWGLAVEEWQRKGWRPKEGATP